MDPKQLKGFSLIEVLISSALLVSAFALVFQLFHSGLTHTSSLETRGRALLLAQNYMNRMRVEAEDPAAFTGRLPTYTTGTFPEGEFTVNTRVVDPVSGAIFSPSRSFETNFIGPPDDRVEMTNSVIQAEVTVSWGPRSGSTSQVDLVSYIAEPERVLDHLVITPSGPTPLSQDAELEFTVRGEDASNDAIEGMTFTWALVPVTARGRLETVDRDGRRVVFKHRYPDEPAYAGLAGAPFSPGGICRLRVRGRANGVVRSAEVDVPLL